MTRFKSILKKFQKKGEKTGWTYIEIPEAVAEEINPGQRKAYRVMGKLDEIEIKGVSLTPMGDASFILAINSSLRKKIGKQSGDSLMVVIEKDDDGPKLSAIFLSCLEEDANAKDFFLTLPKSHQRYFSNWIESAKTDHTKTKRIGQAMDGLSRGWSFGEMIRFYKTRKS